MALKNEKNGPIKYSSKMQQLLIVGDIHGFPPTFVEPLDFGSFEHRVLQLADLSGRPGLHGEELHDYLVNKEGMRHAVQALRAINGRSCIGIGFSAGGTALWSAVKEGLDIQALICVSSTRLRFEISPLNIPTMVFWGELDPHRPTDTWNDAIPGRCKVYTGKQHDFYCNDVFAPNSSLRGDIGVFIEGVSP